MKTAAGLYCQGILSTTPRKDPVLGRSTGSPRAPVTRSCVGAAQPPALAPVLASRYSQYL